jgi:hypothetical protein
MTDSHPRRRRHTEAIKPRDTTDVHPDDEKTYTAYRPGNKVRRLVVRPAKESHRAPAYQHLIDVLSDGSQGKEIGLVFTHATIKLRGLNLQHLAQALASEKALFVQEYDPNRWPERPAKDEAIIDSIEVTSSLTMEPEE